MKRLNLNLELNEELKKELTEEAKKSKTEMNIVKIASIWIKNAIQNACSKPRLNQQGQMAPTQYPSMDDQEKYVKISNCLKSAKDGIAVIEDDTFRWMKEKFNEAQLPMQSGVSEILVEIRTMIKEADIEKK